MIFIWFIYGLAFFSLGLVVLFYPKKPSIFNLANHLWLVACFGLLHGTNEWIDMFIGIGEPFPEFVLKVIRLITLSGSFLFLIIFGTKVIIETKKKYHFLKMLPWVLFGIWLAVLMLSQQRFLIGDISARYLLCLPGTILTSMALFFQVPQFKETKLQNVVINLQLTAVTFLFYAVFAGMIVKKSHFPIAGFLNYETFLNTFGVPVQLFRAICAIVMACSMGYVLGVFRWETQQTQKELDNYRSDMEKKTWLAEVGTMASTMAQKLDEPLAVTKLLLQRVLTDIGKISSNETVVSSLEKSLEEVSRATEIVSRFESTAQVLGRTTSKPIDLYRLTKRMMAVFAQNARQANLTISVKDIDEVLNLSITPRQLEQVFFIMIRNAIGRSVANRQQKLTISCHLNDNQVEFEFADTCQRVGHGKLQNLLEPFLAEATDEQKISLELAVAKKIISEYGGDITAENQPGEEPGVIFRIIFPTQSF